MNVLPPKSSQVRKKPPPLSPYVSQVYKTNMSHAYSRVSHVYRSYASAVNKSHLCHRCTRHMCQKCTNVMLLERTHLVSFQTEGRHHSALCRLDSLPSTASSFLLQPFAGLQLETRQDDTQQTVQ